MTCCCRALYAGAEIKYILIIAFALLSCTGCLYNLEYLRNDATHEFLTKELKSKDILENSDYSVDGVMVIPQLKTFSASHPHPYAQISFASTEIREVVLEKIELKTNHTELIFEKNIGKKAVVDQKRPNGIYRSLSIEVLDSSELSVSELLSQKGISLHCTIRLSPEGSEKHVVVFNLQKRKVKEIAWST